MRERFDKSLAMDAAGRLRLLPMIRNHDKPYTEEEDALLRAGYARLAMFETAGTKAKEAKAPTPTVKNEIAVFKSGGLGWGRSETLVRATKEEILAYVREGAKRSQRTVPENAGRTPPPDPRLRPFVA
jgi:hypothetical protein